MKAAGLPRKTKSNGLVQAANQAGFLSGSGILFQKTFGAGLIDLFDRQSYRLFFVGRFGADRGISFFDHGLQVALRGFVLSSFESDDLDSFLRGFYVCQFDTPSSRQYKLS